MFVPLQTFRLPCEKGHSAVVLLTNPTSCILHTSSTIPSLSSPPYVISDPVPMPYPNPIDSPTPSCPPLQTALVLRLLPPPLSPFAHLHQHPPSYPPGTSPTPPLTCRKTSGPTCSVQVFAEMMCRCTNRLKT